MKVFILDGQDNHGLLAFSTRKAAEMGAKRLRRGGSPAIVFEIEIDGEQVDPNLGKRT